MLTDHGLRTSLLKEFKIETNGAGRLSRSPELLSFWKDPQSREDQGCSGFQRTNKALALAMVSRSGHQPQKQPLSEAETKVKHGPRQSCWGLSPRGTHTDCWERVWGLCFQGRRNCQRIFYKNKRRKEETQRDKKRAKDPSLRAPSSIFPELTLLLCAVEYQPQSIQDAQIRCGRPTSGQSPIYTDPW